MRTLRSPYRAGRDEGGAVAIVVALTAVSLLVITGMVLDFGLIRLDRQTNKSAADDAVAAALHGFDKGDGLVYSYRGACDALTYLKLNLSAVGSLSWADCSDSTKLAKACDTNDSSTWASYTGTANGYTVTISNPYNLATSGFPEESLSSLSSDQGADPCMQLAVIITERRKPGLGSLATSSDLVSTVRSVGRVAVGPGDQAPALLLLDRTHCGVLAVGSGGTGAGSQIHVLGNGTQPGTIHADSDATGSGCGSGSNQQLFQGKTADGIVAYGSTGTPAASGQITSVAGYNGVASGIMSDGTTNTYGTTAPDSSSSGTKSAAGARRRITRSPVDDRYLSGVRTAVTNAQNVFSQVTSSSYSGWIRITDCGPTAGTFTSAGVTSTSNVFMDCSSYNSSAALVAKQVYFASGNISNANLPNAERVYIGGSGAHALSLNNNNVFSMHTTGALSGTTCSDGVLTGTGAQLVAKSGDINAQGGTLQLCNTTVILMGGQTDGCLPATSGTAPTATPCSGGTGNGQVSISGGAVQDWTAPNSYNVIPASLQQTAWSNLEDLAMWSESYGGSNNPSYTMAGGSGMHSVGVFMAPNASPFTVKGGGVQNLTNAQYIATSFATTGGAQLNMRVDPNNTVTLPKLVSFTMVR